MSACVTAATAGDTINVSAGTATWTTTLNLGSKYLSLIGAGQGATVITNNVPGYSAQNGNGSTLIQVSGTGSNFVRISGFTFINADLQTPIINMIGPISAIRIDHITFNKGDSAFGTNWISTPGTGPVYGVADNCTFINMARSYFPTDHRTTDSTGWGDVAWTEFLANPTSFPGSNKMFYFEDNTFTWNSSLTWLNAQGSLYGQYGGKAVFRYNNFTGFCTYVDAHGDGLPAGSAQDTGTIYYEIYNNTFIENDTICIQGDIIWMRGGQLIAHDNSFTGPVIPFRMSIYFTTDIPSHRVQNTYYWNNVWNGITNQANLIAVNDSGQTPTGYSECNVLSNPGGLCVDRDYFLHAPAAGQMYYPYTPYTYPHPLRQAPPQAPRNLQVVVQ